MRAGFVFSLCLGMSAVAYAGTTSQEATGLPLALDTWRPGVFSVATTGSVGNDDGVYLFIDNQRIEPPLHEKTGVGTFLSPMGCLAVVSQAGLIVSQDCLPTGNFIVPVGPAEDLRRVERVKHTASGRGYALANVDGPGFTLLTSATGVEGPAPWTALLKGNGLQQPATLGVTETRGGVPHAVFAVFGPTELIWFEAERQQARTAIPPTVTTREPVTVDVVAPDGLNPFVLFGNDDGLFRGPLVPEPAPSGPFTKVTVQTAEQPVRIVSVDLNTGSGSVHGEGFGLAVGLGPGNIPVVLGAVPAGSEAEAGTVWRIHGGFGGAPDGPAPSEVSCIGSEYCVITLDSPGGNVIIYTNDERPGIQLDGGVDGGVMDLDELTDSGTRASATDLDGDAVRLSVDASGVAGVLDVATTAPATALDALDVAITAREVCKDETVTLPIWASDGLAAHDVSQPLPVRIRNSQGPGAPTVSPSSARVSAGGVPVRFTAAPAAGFCPTVAYQWTANETGETVLTPEGGSATVTPPGFLCDPQGRRFTYTVAGLDVGGMASTTTSFTVDVAPWGRPLAPFPAGATRTLTSGPAASGVDVAPEALHECEGTTGLPSLETQWRLADASTGLPPGVTVRRPDGTPVDFSSTVTGSPLRVEAAACTRAVLSLAAHNRIPLEEGGQLDGPEATVQVAVAPPVEDFSTASLQLGLRPAGGRDVAVDLGTSLVCPAPTVKARMRLVAPDGTTVDADEVAVPGTWTPELPPGCTPATYRVQGALFDEGTEPEQGGGTAEVPLPVEASPVLLGPLEGGTLVARCEEGAATTLTQTIPPEACGDVQLTWERVEGPELAGTPLSGRSVTVATQDTGLDALVGRTLRLGVTASAPDGTRVRREHEVLITAEPFVDVRHELESPTGSEKSLVGVVVELRNTTACGVRGLRFVERVEGLEPVPGSVKLDGQPLEDRPVEGGFEVRGLELPARGSGVLTYVARPQLLSSPRFDGAVYRESVLVSGPIPQADASGCGCSGGGSGAAAFGLAALARLLRRRRR